MPVPPLIKTAHMFKERIEEHILKNGKRTVLFFIMLAVVFFIDKLTLGPLAAVQLHDIFETDFPRYKPMGELLFKHGPYLWYPNWPGGAPAYAWHHSPFYILNIAAQVLPLWAVYGCLSIALMSVAGYGMYRFLSGYLNAAGWVSVVGGVYFALNIQLTGLIVLYTFSYAFPLYFVWGWDFHKRQEDKRGFLILKLIIINLFVALSYPVLTLPYFFIMEVLLIVILLPEGENTRLRMLIKTSLVWVGYILVCLPVLYGLYKYVPASHRTYVYEAASLAGFLKNLYSGFVGSSLHTMTLIPLAGAIAISGKSVRVRRALIVMGIGVFLYGMFSSGMNIVFRGTLFEKMDLGHITTVFPLTMTMAAFVGIDTVIKDRKLIRRFLIGAAAGAACAVFSLFITGTIETQGIQYLILNIGSGVFISLMILTAADKEAFSLHKWAKNPAAVFIVSCAAIAAVFYFSPRKAAPVDLVSIAPVLVVSMWAFFWSCNKLSSAIAEKGQLTALLIMVIGFVIFFQVRFTRLFGEECVPYISIFPNIDVLRTIKHENSLNPFRVASFDSTTIPLIQSQGLETPDSRGPLFNKYYREFFKVVIYPQLSDPGFLAYFETNWYNLFISNFTPNTLFYPYAFLNIRYVVSRGIPSKALNNPIDLVYAGNSIEEHHGIIGSLMKLYSKPIAIVRFKDAFDRCYLVKNIKTLDSDKAVYDTLVRTEGAELFNTVYFSGKDAPSFLPEDIDAGQFKKNQITPEHYTPDEISLKLELATPAAVVVSNNYAPNWRAYVDGRDTKVFRANLAFQSIVIKDAGHHSVVFKYEDRAQKFTLIFIPIGMLVFNYFIITGGKIFFVRL
ncbi:MAG: hypothetical protein HQK96_02050 [Nitrospirae bacterium]|nr:hypothetical protein [Nitrospirota bacterium]